MEKSEIYPQSPKPEKLMPQSEMLQPHFRYTGQCNAELQSQGCIRGWLKSEKLMPQSEL